MPFHSHLPGIGVGLARERERGDVSVPTHDPELHFGPKLRLGRQDLSGEGQSSSLGQAEEQ